MKKRSGQFVCLIAALVAGPAAGTGQAQNQTPDHPAVTVHGKTYTPRSILERNQGKGTDTPGGEMVTQLPPHKIVGNVYYVGARTISSFLIVTSAGNILLNSTYERNVRPILQKSIEELGFQFADTKILLNNHEHGDHAEGDALVKELTGAQVITIAESVSGMQRIKPGRKEHPIDKVIHDGDSVTLGGTTLVAHLTPGHADGGTTWTMKATEGGKTYNVVFYSSIRPPGKITPKVVEDFNRTFSLVRSLPCDVPLSDHSQVFDTQEKYAKIGKGPNPYIDPASCNVETDIEEAMYHAIVQEQEQAAK